MYRCLLLTALNDAWPLVATKTAAKLPDPTKDEPEAEAGMPSVSHMAITKSTCAKDNKPLCICPLQATKAAAKLPDPTKDEPEAGVAPMDENINALEAEAEAELAALAAEASAAAQDAGSRGEDGSIVMLPVAPCSICNVMMSVSTAHIASAS